MLPTGHAPRFSPATIRQMVRDAYGEYLSDEEIEHLVPYLERHFASMQQLHALDLRTGDPESQSYVTDPRVST